MNQTNSNYHIEVWHWGSAFIFYRALRAETHAVGACEYATIPRSYHFICSKCGVIYGRREITQVAAAWPNSIWSAHIGLCAYDGGGSLLFHTQELFQSDRYPDPVPLELLLCEFNCTSALTPLGEYANMTTPYIHQHGNTPIMDLQDALLKVNSVRQRVIEAKAGRGAYPTPEEIRDAIVLLRAGRTSAAPAVKAPKEKKKKEPAQPLDLDSIFADFNPGSADPSDPK